MEMNSEKKYIYLITGAIIIVFLFFYGKKVLSFLPYFKIKNIEIEGNKVITKKDVLKILKISSDDSIFFFNSKSAEKKFIKTGIVKSVKIFTIYPNTLKILLRERYPIAVAKVIRNSKAKYYLIDSEAGIIKQCTSKYSGLPVIVMDYSRVKDLQRFKKNVKNTLYSLSVLYFNNKEYFKRIKVIKIEPDNDKLIIRLDKMDIRFLVKDFLKVRDFLEINYLLNIDRITTRNFSKIDLRFDDIIAK